ncbi:Uncharacterized conserved protein (COG2071) [Chitinophaga ginsengisegetis]|uniref:Uncharacterized conserved protein (COG2071) n=1 Tax=Chitinophaga ginsengisegetis TaxID=393003 RepID=A0A1T5P8S5_9BACT|nr:DUF2071 domain-containing protein [Chitinophaga ginsengisegetis]SKD08973.1 Uncharacterized conserved protein (COG2071) [Chitinophaga ginsengisegetis]
MKLPVIHGYIDRRILVNFTVDPEAVQSLLPSPFRPKIYKGKAIAGICLIRLKHIKPKGWPDFTGISSENGAHRIAVEWEENGVIKEGVYIPRRDTSSRLNALAGGRLFPGKHHLADFNVKEVAGHFHIDFTSSDKTSISIDARSTSEFPATSVFETLENASAFFEGGAVGYSPNNQQSLDGLKLQTYQWKVSPLQLIQVASSFFENTAVFKKGSVAFDNALLMTRTEHEWHTLTGCPQP